MLKLLLATLTAALLLVPAAQAGTEIASGDILVGSPTTEAIGLDGVTSFFFAAPAAGTVLSTVTTDHSGLGYDIDLYFYGPGDVYISGCVTIGTEETGCVVPAGAVTVEVSAWIGADLHVSVQSA